MTYDNREDQFLRQRLQKEIPILRALIQNLYQELDRKFHLNGAKIPITFGFDTDSLGSYTRRHLQQVPDPANTGNASDHFWTLEKRIRQDKKNLGVLIELRKSTAIWDIAYLVGDGVIKMDELEGFGEELIDAVKLILQNSQKILHTLDNPIKPITENALRSQLVEYQLQYRIVANKCKTQEIHSSAYRKYQIRWKSRLLQKTGYIEEKIQKIEKRNL